MRRILKSGYCRSLNSINHTPHIEKYGSLQYVRAAVTGGALIAFLKNDIIFESVSGEMKDATKAFIIHVKMRKTTRSRFVNV